MFQQRAFRVKQISDLTGVSIRTLHHYDEIGLLQPGRMNDAGYRLYSQDDLARLQEILFFRELDFSLAEIRGIIESPGYNRVEALTDQKQLLAAKVTRLKKIIKTIDKTMDNDKRGVDMSNEDLFGGLVDEETQAEYAREAKERWGETDAYKESARKTAKYTRADWERINAEGGDIYSKIADLVKAGVTPEEASVQIQIQKWRDHITANFYNCTIDICQGLGEMYLADVRFKTNIDKVCPGLTEFLSKAIAFYVDNAEA